MFSIVKFPNEKRIDIVRTNWISGNYAVWPPYPSWSPKFTKALEDDDDTANWISYPVQIVEKFGKFSFVLMRLNLL